MTESKHSRRVNLSGLTLIELIVSVAIFSVISLGTFTMFQTVLSVKDRTDLQSADLKGLQRGMSIVSSDIEQIIQRRTRDQFGTQQWPVSATNRGVIEFTKIGWAISPFSKVQRSSLQRVRYHLEDGALVRTHWNVLDQADDSPAYSLALIEGVVELSFRYLRLDRTSGNQEWSEIWPHDGAVLSSLSTTSSSSSASQSYVPDELPIIVEMNMDTERFGKIKRLFRIVGVPTI